MEKDLSYAQQRARANIQTTREILKELPECCGDFMRSIEPSTMPLTRLAYAHDLRIFFTYLVSEVPLFADYTPSQLTEAAINQITARHLMLYNEYLTLYLRKDMQEESNGELGKMRKLASLRSFFRYMFKAGKTDRDVSQLIELPVIHEKPILRLEIDEMVRLLDVAENGSDSLSDRQQKYREHTKGRDLAILTLFLGTGIRVSELVGLDIDDMDFTTNSFLVTRKGGSQSILYYPDEVADVMKRYMAERKAMEALPGHEQALFLSTRKQRITVRAVEYMVKKYAAIAAPLKRRISPHKLRSTFGTNLYHETGDIYVVADVLGHSNVTTTQKHYAAMSDDRRRMAARSVKLREEGDSKE